MLAAGNGTLLVGTGDGERVGVGLGAGSGVQETSSTPRAPIPAPISNSRRVILIGARLPVRTADALPSGSAIARLHCADETPGSPSGFVRTMQSRRRTVGESLANGSDVTSPRDQLSL